jgi:anti-sigma regulatory factor (Ser/Thr protein kinase)
MTTKSPGRTTTPATLRLSVRDMVVASATGAWCTEIPGGIEAPCTAREVLTEVLGDTTPEPTLHDLHLLTTELVTNAVLHAGAGESKTIELRVAGGDDLVRISVTDHGSAGTPEVQDLDLEVPGGMGLFLVEQISSRWGVERLPEGAKRVWFELAA